MAENETHKTSNGKRYQVLPPQQRALETEEAVLGYWERHGIFRRSVEERPHENSFVFYEGPPTANGRPGVHHALSRTIKDLVNRYMTMQGCRVVRKAGWDTHGLPVEIEVEEQLGLDGKDQIEKFGIARFNAECRKSVFRYLDEWHEFTRRHGFWLDLDDPYVTCTNEYIESVWWILQQFWDQDMLFEGHKIVPYCPRCGTALSSHEVSQGYQDIKDPSVTIKLKVVDEDAFFLVWTTTPWTLLSNVALAVGPDFDYVRVRHNDEVLILAEALLHVLDGEREVLERIKGRELVGKRYEPCFPYFKDAEGGFRVIGADFVTLIEGTGIVHMAPAFGEDDYQAGLREGLPFVQPVDERGRFTGEVTKWAGRFIKDADPEIIEDLEERGILYRSGLYEHAYPFCWRCKSPLVYYARRSWYIKTTAFKDLLLEANSKIEWHPPEIGENRFTRWLEGNVDWALSRERYWGTPLNIWICESCGEKYCIGSVEELRSIAEPFGDEFDLHKPFIDELDVGCPECGGKMNRVPEVIDCWFDSGSMPFAQYHYPHENMDLFREQYPADFISEGVEQSRGWFYSLLVIGAFLTKQNPYKRCLPHGMVLDAEGQKMSKSRGNAVLAIDVLKTEGADAIRWYLMTGGAPWLSKRFDMSALKDTANKFLGTLRNLYNFFALYAEIDDFTPTGKLDTTNLIDRWILSRLNSVVREVTDSMEQYELTRAARSIQGFVIDEVSNWYLRRSRRRFWKNEMSGDKLAAYETFRHVLTGMALLAAPFVPFLSEAVYLNLRGESPGSVDRAGVGEAGARRDEKEGRGRSAGSVGTEANSVHLERYPIVNEKLIDTDLERNMQGVLRAVTLGRAVRNKVGIKVRTPVAEMLVHNSYQGDLAWLKREELAALVADELNVKKIAFLEDTSKLISYSVKPEYSVLGKRLGKTMKQAAMALESLGGVQQRKLIDSGEVEIEIDGKKEVITKEEVQILQVTAEGFAAEVEGSLTVIVDTRLTPELVREGVARDLVNRIQNFRKESGLEVSDRIELCYSAPSELTEVFEEYGEHIRSEILAERLEEGERDWQFKTTFMLNEFKVELAMRRL
ncbi:MAG: isoleucine--tRNA ligase [bacterium]|nr:MAG: isoleucine--tRNA ligase [bacterium]